MFINHLHHAIPGYIEFRLLVGATAQMNTITSVIRQWLVTSGEWSSVHILYVQSSSQPLGGAPQWLEQIAGHAITLPNATRQAEINSMYSALHAFLISAPIHSIAKAQASRVGRRQTRRAEWLAQHQDHDNE